MKYTSIICIFLLSISTSILGQNKQDYSKNYTPMSSLGEIPSQVLMDIGQIKEMALNKREKVKDANKIYDASDFQLFQLFSGGSVLFGDESHTYVNKVASQVLKNDDKLLNEMTFYVYKSHEVNIFSTYHGCVFVTTGLLSKLKNEAELAFLIAVEVEIYVQQSFLNSFIELKDLAYDKEFSMMKEKDKIKAMSKMNTDFLIKADEMALSRLSKTQYDLTLASKALEVLKYDYLPFEEKRFNKSFFEDSFYKFPPIFDDFEVNVIALDDKYSELKSNNKGASKRIEKIEKILRKYDGKGGKSKFIVSESDFEKVRTTCRFEQSRLLLINQKYGESIYNTFLLLNYFPENIYLHATMGKSLFSLGYYKDNTYDKEYEKPTNTSSTNKSGYFEITEEQKQFYINKYLNKEDEEKKPITIVKSAMTPYIEAEGEQSGMFYFLNTLSSPELYTLGIKYLWEKYEKYGDYYGLKQFAEKATEKFVFKYKRINRDYYADSFNKETYNETISKKYDSIDLYRLPNPYVFYTLTQSKSGFWGIYEGATVTLETQKEYEEEWEGLDGRIKNKVSKFVRKENRKRDKHGASLGLSRLIMLGNTFAAVNINKKKVDNKRTNRYNRLLAKSIPNASSKSKLEVELIYYMTLNKDDVEKYNAMSILKSWSEEYIGLEKYSFLISQTYLNEDISTEYSTNYMLYNLGVFNQNGFVFDRTYAIVFSVIFPSFVAAYDEFAPISESRNVSVLFDIKNEDVLFVDIHDNLSKVREDYLTQYYYFLFHQINRQTK